MKCSNSSYEHTTLHFLLAMLLILNWSLRPSEFLVTSCYSEWATSSLRILLSAPKPPSILRLFWNVSNILLSVFISVCVFKRWELFKRQSLPKKLLLHLKEIYKCSLSLVSNVIPFPWFFFLSLSVYIYRNCFIACLNCYINEVHPCRLVYLSSLF